MICFYSSSVGAKQQAGLFQNPTVGLSRGLSSASASISRSGHQLLTKAASEEEECQDGLDPEGLEMSIPELRQLAAESAVALIGRVADQAVMREKLRNLQSQDVQDAQGTDDPLDAS